MRRVLLMGFLAVLAGPLSAAEAAIDGKVVLPGGSQFKCINAICLSAKMRKAHAPREAWTFARDLTATRRYGVAWAVSFRKFGKIDLVTYNCHPCDGGGFAMVNGSPPIVPDTFIFSAMNQRLQSNPTFKAQHPSAILIGVGERFAGVHPLPQGVGQRFTFVNLIGDCETCPPYASIWFAFDFDDKGRLIAKRTLDFGPVSAIAGTLSPPKD